MDKNFIETIIIFIILYSAFIYILFNTILYLDGIYLIKVPYEIKHSLKDILKSMDYFLFNLGIASREIIKSILEFEIIDIPLFGKFLFLETTPLIITGFIVEKHYQSRLSYLPNSLALILAYHGLFFENLTIELIIYFYILCSFSIGLIALYSYALDVSWRQYHHDFFGITFSTIIIFLLIFFRNIIVMLPNLPLIV